MTSIAVEDAACGRVEIRMAFELMLISLLIFLLRWGSRIVTFFSGRKIERMMRGKIYRNILKLSQDEMDTYRTGDLVSRLINDVSDIRMVLGSGFLQVTNNIIAYAMTITVMLMISPQLAVSALLPFIPVFMLARFFTTKMHDRSVLAQKALGTLSSIVEESVAGIEVLKSHISEKWQTGRFKELNFGYYESERNRARPESGF
ncbi:TPA: hypothetical protein DEF17_05050, partial [bacterium]|nr:hypothetical protein [bacterium]